MTTDLLKSIEEEFGNRASSSPMERELYSRRSGPVPALMVDPLFRTTADLIVRPTTTEEVVNLVRRAGAEGIPVTPRAGATTVFNAVPVKGGIVIDLNALSGVVALDEAGMTVTVKAATVWSELEAYLNALGPGLQIGPQQRSRRHGRRLALYDGIRHRQPEVWESDFPGEVHRGRVAGWPGAADVPYDRSVTGMVCNVGGDAWDHHGSGTGGPRVDPHASFSDSRPR